MSRMRFDSQGKLSAITSDSGESVNVNSGPRKSFSREKNGSLNGVDDWMEEEEEKEGFVPEKTLRTSNSLKFLREDDVVQGIKDEGFWSLYDSGNKLNPLMFSNGKTQEDVVKEVVGHIQNGKRMVFIHGACGTGKSAIALNIARKLGRACIVVPVKGLQRQYEEDYSGKKYVVKENGRKMSIAMITGRENHDSLIKPGASCADPFLPDTVKIADKNISFIKEFYEQNPYIKNKMGFLDVKKMKRISIAPANPYWSPIAPEDYELPLKDAKKKKYKGLQGRNFIFYHRQEGCSYYDQYLAYMSADVLIFNSAKYKIEVALDRKPYTNVDIIDEADEFLDSFSTQEDLNLTRLGNALGMLRPDNPEAQDIRDKIFEFISLEEKNKKALGIDEKKIFKIEETNLAKIFKLFLSSSELHAEILSDELNYCNKAVEVAEIFSQMMEDTYVLFSRKEDNLYCSIVTTNLSQKFKEMADKLDSLVFMSGTLHSREVLKKIFGVDEFAFVEAEVGMQGTLEVHMTGKEKDCKYANFKSGNITRKDYLLALDECLIRAKKPVLVHVNAFEDLPSEAEIVSYNLRELMSKEMLLNLQGMDKTGKLVSDFKNKLRDVLFSSKCSRGVDFPGDTCNSIIFTKYPNPNVQGTFWKILERTHPEAYWDFYRDKARREYLQRIFRGLRSKNDHVYLLSPDMRVLDSARKIQQGKF